MAGQELEFGPFIFGCAGQVSNKVDSGMSSIGDILKFTYGIRVVDKSDLYSGYKDVNDWWVNKV